jgi:hypothetical protein
LPSIQNKLHDLIDQKLQAALNISLISDICSNRQLASFIAVTATTINKFFKKESIVGDVGVDVGVEIYLSLYKELHPYTPNIW